LPSAILPASTAVQVVEGLVAYLIDPADEHGSE